MLKSFHVKDYALIGQLDVEFGKGLNIITGETGAGKSILIDAMSLLLGERASTEVIRKGSQKAIVEGIFELSSNPVSEILSRNDIDVYEQLILRRELSAKGNNRCFVNDTPVALNLFREIGNLLVDLHGQHEHQSLLRTETHIDFLDQYSDTSPLLEEYKKLYDRLHKLLMELKHLASKEKEIRERRDFYSYQIREIDAVNPGIDEEAGLNSELKILENSEKLLELTGEAYQLLYDSENAAYDKLVKVKQILSDLSKIDAAFNEVTEECETAVSLVNDISEFIRSYNSKISVEPEHLEKIRERLSSLIILKKKYGGSLKSLIDYRTKIGEEVLLAENFEERIDELTNEINICREKCGSEAEKLSARRIKSADKIRKEVTDFLSYLGIPSANFEVRIQKKNASAETNDYIPVKGNRYSCSSKGIDDVEFYISTNPGEDLKPLAKVASGGEVSRIMLALKSVLAKNEKLPLLIFDEIDTGVSGRIAQKVGNALKKLAAFHQVISITHLPQIAGLADTHFSVEKTSAGGRAESSIKKLNEQERIKEIAKLMSGENVTEASMLSAKELMGIE